MLKGLLNTKENFSDIQNQKPNISNDTKNQAWFLFYNTGKYSGLNTHTHTYIYMEKITKSDQRLTLKWKCHPIYSSLAAKPKRSFIPAT